MDERVQLFERLRAAPELLSLAAATEGSELAFQKRLRGEFPEELVPAALALVECRARGRVKFSRADEMWFDRLGLEQATPEAVAAHTARRFAAATQGQSEDGSIVQDWCSGIGADAIALAAAGCEVRAVDLDPLKTAFTEWNAAVYGVAERVRTRVADVTTIAERDGWLHLDPDRRAGGAKRRTIRIEAMSPGLDLLRPWMDEFRGGAVKLSPASNFQDKFTNLERGVEIELVSLHGECKQATVWFGDLVTEHEWRVTVLPANATLAGDPLGAYAMPGPLGAYLYDPDPGVVRAGLVDVLAEEAGLERLDEAEEYLTAETLVETPFATPFRVLAEVPNNNREIRRAVREAGFGQVEIKCRHVPIDAEAIRRKLPLVGREPGVLVFARIGGRTRCVIARRVVV